MAPDLNFISIFLIWRILALGESNDSFSAVTRRQAREIIKKLKSNFDKKDLRKLIIKEIRLFEVFKFNILYLLKNKKTI